MSRIKHTAPHKKPPTDKQLAVAEWYCNFRNIELDEEDVSTQGKLWWALKQLITSYDYEIAREVQMDYGKPVNYEEPFSVIFAMQYWDAVRKADKADQQQWKYEAAKKQLLKNASPFDVAEQFMLADDELYQLANEIERDHNFIVEGL